MTLLDGTPFADLHRHLDGSLRLDNDDRLSHAIAYGQEAAFCRNL